MNQLLEGAIAMASLVAALFFYTFEKLLMAVFPVLCPVVLH